MLSVLRYTDSDYPFGIFKFFLTRFVIHNHYINKNFTAGVMNEAGEDILWKHDSFFFWLPFVMFDHILCYFCSNIVFCLSGL